MASETTKRLLDRELPAFPMNADGTLAHASVVSAWCHSAASLIEELRDRVELLERESTSGADAFNRMVRLGNKAAENIVSNAHQEARRILAAAHQEARTVTTGAAPTVVPTEVSPLAAEPDNSDFRDSDLRDSDFRTEWKKAASIDERYADRAFFENGEEEPSRAWILADSANESA